MGSLGQVDAFLTAEQPFDETIDLLPANKSDARDTLSGRRHLESNQSKSGAAVLMGGQAIPQSRQFAAPQSLHRVVARPAVHTTTPQRCATVRARSRKS